MQIQFVNLQKQNQIYNNYYRSILKSVLKSAAFIEGPQVSEFEKNFAGFYGKKYCIGVNSGTDALILSLTAYNIGQDDEVITAPNSYFSTAMAINIVGAKAVFADIDPQTYTINPKEIERKVNSKTKAIIPIHLFGQAADMKPIIKIAQKYKLKIIEDCCQAHGCKYMGKRVPVCETGAFSFYPGKNLGGFGDGGAIVTDNKMIADKIRYLRNDGSVKKYLHEIIGYKSRLDTIQAAILNFKLTKLEIWNKLRKEHAKLYTKLLKEIPQITTPFESACSYHVYHLYVIEAQKRDKLQKYLKKHGIATIIHYPIPIHLQKPYRKEGYKIGDYPITEKKAKNILSLPMYPELNDKEIHYIVKTISQYYLQN